MLRYWKSATDLPAYLAYKVKALNPGVMATVDTRLDMLRTEPIGCILLIHQDASPGSLPTISLIAAPSLAPVSAGSTRPIRKAGTCAAIAVRVMTVGKHSVVNRHPLY
jgi:hypothetical protein